MKNFKLLFTTTASLVLAACTTNGDNQTSTAVADTQRANQLRAVVFRVLNPQGSPVDGAEVRIRITNTTVVKCPRDRCQGRTVQGLFQTFVPCVKLKGTPPQYRFEYEIWSGQGKTATGYWWQSPGSWTCDKTLEFNEKLEPLVHDKASIQIGMSGNEINALSDEEQNVIQQKDGSILRASQLWADENDDATAGTNQHYCFINYVDCSTKQSHVVKMRKGDTFNYGDWNGQRCVRKFYTCK